ncbi:MAG: transcriptional regulator, partial [Pseudoflavonifractor sp.]
VYRRYEKGTREIPVWAVLKLAEYYGTSTDYILGRTDNPSLPHA